MKTKSQLIILMTSIHLIANTQTWVGLNTGTNGWATALKEDTTNNILYTAGNFTQAGGGTASHISKWNGTNWTAIGSGTDYPVHALEIIGGELYVGGEFLTVDGIFATRIAKYDGTSWTALGSGIEGSVNSIAEYSGAIYVGHLSDNSTPYPYHGIKKWNGSSWINVGTGVGGTNVDVLGVLSSGIILLRKATQIKKPKKISSAFTFPSPSGEG